MPSGITPLALGRADRHAQIGLAAEAIFALPAFRRVERDDVIALFQAGHAGPISTTMPAPSWPRIDGKMPSGIAARQGELVGVADAGGLDLDQHLAGARSLEIDRFQAEFLPALRATAARTFMLALPRAELR